MARVRPSIPKGAAPRVVSRDEAGNKTRSKYYLGGKLVGEMLWEPSGIPSWGWGIRAGKKHGLSVEWHDSGEPSFAEPFVDGLVHGTVRHWDERGKLLLETRYVKGTGVDLWCDLHNRTLSEETRTEGGQLRVRRLWNSDARSVWLEETYCEGGEHGIFREWNDEGQLRRGFPRYFVRGERVDKRAYLRAGKSDPTLPPFRRVDDDPRRMLPPEFIGQPIHRERRKR